MRIAALLLAAVLAAGTGWAASPDEDEDRLYPFPPGPGAALTREVCTACHGANVVVRRRYDEDEARRLYRLMIGDPGNERAQRIIAYLTETLGDD
ncbi:hypothetical protein [Muricoccus radiodurans]|uniref:hypothetical protein n=1 Tax=Muricoccus radiodurans TaxID=2231721 RepID=UPI003CF65C85